MFHKNRYSESSTSLAGINVFLFVLVLSTFIGLGKIQYVRLAHIVLLNICQLPENWRREGHAYGCKLKYITAYTVSVPVVARSKA